MRIFIICRHMSRFYYQLAAEYAGALSLCKRALLHSFLRALASLHFTLSLRLLAATACSNDVYPTLFFLLILLHFSKLHHLHQTTSTILRLETQYHSPTNIPASIMTRSKAPPADNLSDDDLTMPPNTESLDDLLSNDCVAALDLVDELRSCGLDSIFQLPQLVVCGDQSAGKSSVLEALTQVPFPTKENLCTRFATQIVIRRGGSETIRTKIIPEEKLNAREKEEMIKFNRTIRDFRELPKLIEGATEHMGLNKPAVGNSGSNKRQKVKAFSRNVLSIEIEGPGRRPLTLVDLPGWINTPTIHHSEDDMKLIQGLIADYIKQERTIILAVISAKSDLATQTILTKCQDVDPLGRRTLGIITKPDTVPAGSDLEKDWLEVARNKNIPLELGWHMLRNR